VDHVGVKAPGRPIKKTFLPLHRSAMFTAVGMPSVHGPSCNTPEICSPTLAILARAICSEEDECDLDIFFCSSRISFFEENKFFPAILIDDDENLLRTLIAHVKFEARPILDVAIIIAVAGSAVLDDR